MAFLRPFKGGDEHHAQDFTILFYYTDVVEVIIEFLLSNF
jgi:hypothetical protein